MSRTVLAVISAVLCLGVGCTHAASVALNPVTNRIYWTKEDSLKVCDQSLGNCQEHRLGMKPEGASMDSSGRLLFVEGSRLYRCDDTGGACQQFTLPFGNARQVAVSSAGRVVVLSASGEVALCDEGQCSAAPAPAAASSTAAKP